MIMNYSESPQPHETNLPGSTELSGTQAHLGELMDMLKTMEEASRKDVKAAEKEYYSD